MTLRRAPLVLIVAVLAGCGGQQSKGVHVAASPGAPVAKAVVAPATAHKAPAVATHRASRPHSKVRHAVHIQARPAAPAGKPKPRVRGITIATCLETRSGLRKVVGTHVSPADNSAAPALVARLEGLGRRESDATLTAAIARATTLAKQWASVLVIGPDDKLRAERLGNEVTGAVSRVNAAAKAAGLGACAIALG